jgi:pterin-4a-carbinolamine dehydratase
MNKIDSWEEVSNKLIRTYYFKGNDGVAEFVNKVMGLAAKHKLHPNIIVNYDCVKLSVFDSEKGKVTDRCHKFAAVIDKI